MARITLWMNEQKTAILQEHDGKWTWDEFDASIDEAYALVRSVDHMVDIVVDNRHAPMPPSPTGMSHFKRAWELQPANLGMIIIVGANPFLASLSGVLNKALVGPNGKTRLVATLNDALALVQERRPMEQSGG